MSGAEPPASRAAWLVAALAVAGVSVAPFARGLVSGASFYFRDLSGQFFPARRFAVEGLLQGQLRFWNPHIYEGVPTPLPPLSYPLDLLQLLWPNEPGFTALLALHVPLAALAALLLARSLGIGVWGAAAAAVIYSLGGFALSTINLYVYVQTLAWAPVMVWSLLRVAEAATSRRIGIAALSTAVTLSTTGAELLVQAAVAAGVLIAATRASHLLRTVAPLALAVALCAPTIATILGSLAGSAREGGFPTEIVLAQSAHPFSLLQVLVADLHGDLADPVNRWWGHNFFPRGFPYILSLYLGATALALAATGALLGGARRGPLLLLVGAGLLIALGRFGPLAWLAELAPGLMLFRFPIKAFFTVHLGIAMLAGLGLDCLARERRAGRSIAVFAAALGVPLLALRLAPRVAPESTAWFVAHFFPPRMSQEMRLDRLAMLLDDASAGAGIAVLAALIGLAVARSKLKPALAAALLVGLVTADLLRAGTGLNPMVSEHFCSPSETARQVAAAVSHGGGRVFTCNVEGSPAYWSQWRARGERREIFTFRVSQEALLPDFNVALGVDSALSVDRTMLVPEERVLHPDDASCQDLDALLPLLGAAAVGHVISLDPLEHPDLTQVALAHPPRIAPLVLNVYRLGEPARRIYVASRVIGAKTRDEAQRLSLRAGFVAEGNAAVEGAAGAEGAAGTIVVQSRRPGALVMEVETDGPTWIVVREAFHPGWRAGVGGHDALVARANGRHLGVAVPAGRTRVRLTYEPPGIFFASAVSALAALAVGLLLSGFGARRADPSPPIS